MTSHADAKEKKPAPNPIPWDTALEICAAIQAENRHRWYTPNGVMCRGCMTFSRGSPAKMCFANRPDNRGCYQVNARYDRKFASSTQGE